MSAASPSSSTVLSQLRLRWLAFAGFSLAFWLGGFWVLEQASGHWTAGAAWRWLALSGPALAYLLGVLWRGLGENYRPGEGILLPNLGPGNALTLLRGVLVAGLVGFLFSPQPVGWLAWLPAVLYSLADASDYFDGYLARRSNHATRLGELLDQSFDGVGVLAAAGLAVQYGQVPPAYLLVALARYLFVGGLWLRRWLGKPVYDLPPSVRRRAFAGVQMGFIAIVLFPVFVPPGSWIAATLFALPFLVGFAYDWLFVSGALRPRLEQGEPGAPRLPHPLRRALPLALRGLAAAMAAAVFFQLAGAADTPLAIALAWLHACVAGLVLLGIAGRTVAILGLALMGLSQVAGGFGLPHVLLLAAYTSILFLGTGALSLWTPEEWLIYHKAGEREGI